MRPVEYYIQKCWNKGSESNYIQIAIEPYFIQIIAPKKGMELYIDGISNAHLPEENFLTLEQIQQIKDLGFEGAPRSKDFSIALPFGRDPANYTKAGDIVRALMAIYGMDPQKSKVEEMLEF